MFNHIFAAIAAVTLGRVGQRRWVDAKLCLIGGSADRNAPTGDGTDNAFTGRCVEVTCDFDRKLARGGFGDGSGCGLARSTAAANWSSSTSAMPPNGSNATTLGLPSVSVPVLSTSSVSIFSVRSSASAFLTRT